MAIANNMPSNVWVLLCNYSCCFYKKIRAFYVTGHVTDYANFRTADGRFMGKAIGMGTSPRGLRIGALRPNLLVADLGTEQQSNRMGGAQYLKDRAVALTESLGGEARLVLHGTSCLSPAQMQNLGDDGIVRINMWTRIVREAGQYAAEQLSTRMDLVRANDFEACESRQYLDDSIEEAVRIMIEVMESIGYARLAI